MNLIEELGLEKCKQIVDGAPNSAFEWRTNGFYYTKCGMYYCVINKEFFKSWTENAFASFTLDDLRAAIADHNRTDYVSDIRNHIAPTTVVIER